MKPEEIPEGYEKVCPTCDGKVKRTDLVYCQTMNGAGPARGLAGSTIKFATNMGYTVYRKPKTATPTTPRRKYG